MRKHIDWTGFDAPVTRPLGDERRTVAFAQLIAIVALALSTIVVGTVVSVGIARANVASGVIDHESGLFGVALLLGLIFLALGGMTVIPRRGRVKE
jgi:ABC-type enterochelin transport system permease subunit